MPQSLASLHCHIVLSTKHREPLITGDLPPRLYGYIGGTLRQHSSSLLAAGGMPDHVHLLVSLGRTLAVADTVRVIKSNSGWIHEEFSALRGFHWQDGYGAFAVSNSNLSAVKEYIGNQKEHHRALSFKEEFLEFLRRHNLEWDERYVWD